MSETRTQFDYLLNAFEEASQSDDPAANDYHAKRVALFGYVRALESPAPIAGKAEMPEVFQSVSCEGERCSMCGEPATMKLGEEIMHDDPRSGRHNWTAYVCRQHGRWVLFGERPAPAHDRERLLAENAAFRQREMDHENAEASVCPEDVGFVEYVGSLKSALDRAQRERDEAINRAVIAGYLYAIERLCAMGEEMANDGYERSYAIAEGYANHYVEARASLPSPEGKV